MLSDHMPTRGQAPAEQELLIVDRAIYAEVMAKRLRRGGFRVRTAESVESAMAALRERRADLVLADMAFNGNCGLKLLRSVRAHGALGHLPVVLLTARADAAAAIAALDAGADDHLAKPFDFDVLAVRIRRLIAQSRTIAGLLHANALLDQRVAERSAALGQVHHALTKLESDRTRLVAAVSAMEQRLHAAGAIG